MKKLRAQILIRLISYLLFFSLQVCGDLGLHDLPVESPSSNFLKDVLKAISVKKGWNLEKVRVSNVETSDASIAVTQRYEFRLKYGRTDLVFRFSDDATSWKRLEEGGEFGPDLISTMVSKPILEDVELEGPLELLVDADTDMTLLLPLNVTFRGIKRVLLGKGISLKVESAQEISLIYSNFASKRNRRFSTSEDMNKIFPLNQPSCELLPHIHISGSATISAYRTGNPGSYMETTFLAKETIELVAEKCYIEPFSKYPPFPIRSLISKVSLLERLLKNFVLDSFLSPKEGPGSLISTITASTVVRFRLKLVRILDENDLILKNFAAWRTKPSVDHAWFEILARFDGESLKPLSIKRIRPLLTVDTIALSDLLFNVSFTQSPSIIGRPEPLTLDI